jgi:hypothetical protein
VAINSKLFKDFELAQGDVIRTSDSLANQTRNAQAEFENLKTELGERLTPIFATVVGGITGLLEKLGELPEPIRNTLGAIAGIGSFGAVAVGGLSIVAGQAIKLRDAFTTTTTAVVDGVETQRRSMNKLGAAAVVFGKIAAALAISESIFALVNSATNATGRLEDALNRTLVAAQATGPGLLDAFAGTVKAVDLELGIGKVFTDFGTNIELGADRAKSSVEDTQQAFDKLKGLDPQVASATLDQLQRVTDGLDKNSGQFKANQEFIDRNRESLRLSAEADKAKADSVDGVAGAMTDAEPTVEVFRSTVEGVKVATEEADGAFQAYADTLKANTDPFFAVIDAAGNLGDAQAKVAEAYIALFTDGATAQEFIDLADAQRDAVSAGISLESTIATLRDGVQKGNIEYGSAIETLDLLAQKYPALAAPGGPIDQVKQEFFFAALAAKGLADASPIDVQVSTTGTDVAIDNINGVNDAVARLYDNINTSLAFGGLLGPGVPGTPVPPDRPTLPNQPGYNPNTGTITPFRRAIGGPVAAGQEYYVGEEGPELFVPRTAGRVISNGQLRGEVNQTFNITTPDPILTAAEVVRRQRDAEFLAGV